MWKEQEEDNLESLTDRVRISNRDLRADGSNTEVKMSLVWGTMKTIGMEKKKKTTLFISSAKDHGDLPLN